MTHPPLLRWAPLLALVTLTFATAITAKEDDQRTHKLPLHELTPDFTLKALHGKNLKLSEQRGDVVILTFWATWCNTCRQVLPLFNTLYKNYKKTGLVVYGITVDDDPAQARRTAEQLGLTFPILHDQKRTVSEAYKLENTPTTYFIARDGSLRSVREGFQPGIEAQLEQEIRQMLGE